MLCCCTMSAVLPAYVVEHLKKKGCVTDQPLCTAVRILSFNLNHLLNHLMHIFTAQLRFSRNPSNISSGHATYLPVASCLERHGTSRSDQDQTPLGFTSSTNSPQRCTRCSTPQWHAPSPERGVFSDASCRVPGAVPWYDWSILDFQQNTPEQFPIRCLGHG